MKVLVVEDERKLGEVLLQGLREHGYAAEWAEDGALALGMARRRIYDALIVDVMLPGMDGFQLLETLRSEGDSVPILMLTARSGVDDRVRGLDLGADDYLPKPFEFKEMLARLRSISRRPMAQPQTVLVAADLELNLQTHEVRRGGQTLDLTAKEFLLLELLLRHKGLVVTRTMIMDRIWNTDGEYETGSNLVEVYINFLRKKVDSNASLKLIQTVRGAGYILKEPA
jgi:DNA-binding response OmpR family regulator